jgi:hypothetical protein
VTKTSTGYVSTGSVFATTRLSFSLGVKSSNLETANSVGGVSLRFGVRPVKRGM